MQLQIEGSRIALSDANGNALYAASLAGFAADGGAAPSLPAGMSGLLYRQEDGYLAYADATGNLFPEPGVSEVTELDAILANARALVSAQSLRLNGTVAAAVAAIDAAAEAARLRYITGGAGQAATYIVKAEQAEAFKAAAYAGTVPGMVQAEVDATGKTAQQAADYILATRDGWVAKAAQIERARRRADVAVAAASGPAAIISVRDAALAALAAL